MASVDNVKLKLVENQGAAAALVTYRVKGSVTDGQGRTFTERVELIGVDAIAGEDGVDEVIPGVGFQRSLISPFGILQRSQLLALQGSSLDEDRNLGPIDLRVDEIQARVTLSRNSQVRSSASSEIVRRGGIVLQPLNLPG